MARKIEVEVVGDERDLLRSLRRSSDGLKRFNREASHIGRGAAAGSGAFRGLGRSIAFASGAFLGAAGLTAAVRGAFSELADAQRVTAQTNAVLKSTGGIAGVTAEHVDKLGTALLRKSGIDDEVIKSGENVLLTFTNIRNVAGENNDIFDQATKAALDLSVAMGTDLQSAIVQVGKALSDPVKGATALKRVGVTLTAQQQDQIKTLVRQNNLLGAQKVILGELTKEFGGQAAALGRTPLGKLNLLRETFKNFSAEVVAGTQAGIVPLIDRLQKWFDNTKNVARVQKDLEDAIKFVSLAAEFLGKIIKALIAIFNVVDKAWDRFARHIEIRALKTVRNIAEPFSHLPGVLGGWARRAKDRVNAELAKIRPQIPGVTGPVGTPVTGDPFKPPGVQGPVVGALPPDTGETAASKSNKWFDALIARRLGRVQDIRTLRGQIATLTEIAGLIQKRLKVTKDVTRRLKLEDDLVGIFRTRAGLRTQIVEDKAARDAAAKEKRQAGRASILARLGFGVDRAAATKNLSDDVTALNKLAAELRRQIKLGGDVLALQEQLFSVTQDIRAKRAEQAQKVVADRQARQFRALGLTGEGEERVPGVKTLRGLLKRVDKAVEGTFLDTKGTRGLLAGIRKVLSGGLGAVSSEVRSKIREMLADINRQLREHENKVGTRFRKANVNALLAGVGLTADQIRALRARLSQVGPGGTVPGTGRGAFGFALPAGGGGTTIEVPVMIDGWQIAKVTTKSQQKSVKRNPTQKRGIVR